MDSVRQSMGGGVGIFLKVIFVGITLYILYLCYNFLFSNNANQLDFPIYTAVTLGRSADYAAATAPTIVFPTSKVSIFSIATGSEFSISTWVYYKDPSYKNGKNKHILSIVDNSGTCLVVFLGGYQNSLGVRTNTVLSGGASRSNPIDMSALFDTTAPISGTLANQSNMCDINQIDLQKWVLVNVVSNGTTLDVYLDGKLGRSCILPGSIYINNSKTVSLKLFEYGGFGGYVSNLSLHQYALNPEQIWRYYMKGPGPSYTPWQYIQTLFDPKAVGSFSYPAYPGT